MSCSAADTEVKKTDNDLQGDEQFNDLASLHSADSG